MTEDSSQWAADEIGKRASRAIFQDLAVALTANAAPDVLPKILQLK